MRARVGALDVACHEVAQEDMTAALSIVIQVLTQSDIYGVKSYFAFSNLTSKVTAQILGKEPRR